MKNRRRRAKIHFQKWIMGKTQFFFGLAAGLLLAALAIFLKPSHNHGPQHYQQPLAIPQAQSWAPARPSVAVARPAPRKAVKKVSRPSRKRYQSRSAINEPQIRLIKKSQYKKAYKPKKRASKRLARPSKASVKRIGRAG